jgi:hypothetical protein
LKVLKVSDVRRETDILVLPENHFGFLQDFAPWPNRKVVLFQGLMLGVRGLHGKSCYSDFGVTDLLCTGHQAASYCRLRFPKLNVVVAPVLIDTGLFRPSAEKTLEIAYLPRKRSIEAAFIRDLFTALDRREAEVRWNEIGSVPEQQLAMAFGKAAIYLSLPRLETCGMTTLEAMAAGCLCVGFTGGGGRDYADARNGLWVEEDDCMGAVRELQRAVDIICEHGDLYSELIHHSLETAGQYRRERFVTKLARFWRSVLPGE